MAVIRFPVSATKQQPDPSSNLMKSIASAALATGADRRATIEALRRVAAALERRQG
jgi:hypothetical protein